MNRIRETWKDKYITKDITVGLGELSPCRDLDCGGDVARLRGGATN